MASMLMLPINLVGLKMRMKSSSSSFFAIGAASSAVSSVALFGSSGPFVVVFTAEEEDFAAGLMRKSEETEILSSSSSTFISSTIRASQEGVLNSLGEVGLGGGDKGSGSFPFRFSDKFSIGVILRKSL